MRAKKNASRCFYNLVLLVCFSSSSFNNRVHSHLVPACEESETQLI